MSAMLSAEQLQFKEAVSRFLTRCLHPAWSGHLSSLRHLLPEMSGIEHQQNWG